MVNLKGKTALITGASRGIGRAIALCYAEYGCDIAFTDIHRDDAAEQLICELETKGVKAHFIESNAADFDATNAALDKKIEAIKQSLELI